MVDAVKRSRVLIDRVKHLNPRQGITTLLCSPLAPLHHTCGVKHLNPRQGITTCAGRQNVGGDRLHKV